jgi:hypothetical protein
MAAPSLVLQTTYAELLERCAHAAFGQPFDASGAFTAKTINGRRYWYFQSSAAGVRKQRYVGPEAPDLLERIAHHREARNDERERRSLVSTLVRSFGMPRPLPEVGAIIDALAKAGVFRLRGVLVGTVAYQAYSAMLGGKLPAAALQTGDVDIAQFKNISLAVDDKTPPVLDVLRQADKSFRPVPTIYGDHVTSYTAKSGFRVDFLTPNEGRETDKPQRLAALQTDAQPLRFLDFLIHDPEPAVICHGPGIYVNVPSPHRYAVHKLMVAQRRPEGAAKRDKDIRQADALLALLAQRRAHELEAALEEAFMRGKEWQKLLAQGVAQLSPALNDKLSEMLRILRKPPAT